MVKDRGKFHRDELIFLFFSAEKIFFVKKVLHSKYLLCNVSNII